MCVCACGDGWGIWELRNTKNCGKCGDPAPEVERADSCGSTWPRDVCPYCNTEGVLWLDGGCWHCEKTWDPSVCARNGCDGGVRTKDYRDWGLEPQPDPPPFWILYLIGCGHSLGHEPTGMGGTSSKILQTEAESMLKLFPRHQHALIRRVLGTLERVGAECEREMALKREDEKPAEGVPAAV